MKERIDIQLVERGLAPTRERAQAYLMAGVVRVCGRQELKAGTKFDTSVEIEVISDPIKFVSRGGLKLEGALDEWDIDLDGAVCVDIGASTGGFTDLMLSRGAEKVYAIDVGYGQLDYKLRQDSRVVNMERTNVRYLDPESIPEKADFVSIDVSFISLKHIFPVAAGLLNNCHCGLDPTCAGTHRQVSRSESMDSGSAAGMTRVVGASIVALVKPQFEALREQVGKGGIIRDTKIHDEVLEKVKGYAGVSNLDVLAVMPSPITGTKGNKEFLMWLR
ncbi:MAG: TlyA family RNA methyltransferase [Clostridiales Family XIII bacterium]|nr:TlyA family RNA methyltransferase [Clostridiales Family XIII bacterium]